MNITRAGVSAINSFDEIVGIGSADDSATMTVGQGDQYEVLGIKLTPTAQLFGQFALGYRLHDGCVYSSGIVCFY